MENELDYLLDDSNRLILLLRSCDDVEKRQKYLDDLNRNIEEIRRLHSEKE